MNSLEITKACAKAMGIEQTDDGGQPMVNGGYYKPLNDDAQAMALVKKFRLDVHHGTIDDFDTVVVMHCMTPDGGSAESKSLNRAICECVAKMVKQ